MRLSFLLAFVSALWASAQSPPSSPMRLAQMQHHFSQVFAAHEAVIRGDLPSLRAPAVALSSLPVPEGMPPAAGAYVASIRRAAGRVLDATALAPAAAAVADMLAQCGNCHRAVGVPVAISTPPARDLGGIVGHMLEHQRAADAMLEGVIAPSRSLWQTGADRLARAALLPETKLPSDLRLLEAVRHSEERLHDLAKRAAAEINAPAHQDLYAQIMTTCAECHSLHQRIWGPTRGR